MKTSNTCIASISIEIKIIVCGHHSRKLIFTICTSYCSLGRKNKNVWSFDHRDGKNERKAEKQVLNPTLRLQQRHIVVKKEWRLHK